MEAIDLSSVSARLVSRLIESLPIDPKLSDRVISLFRKAWAAFPQQRYALIYVRQARGCLADARDV